MLVDLSKDVLTDKIERLKFDLHSITDRNEYELKQLGRQYIGVFKLSFVLDGEMILKANNVKYSIKENSCLIIAPGVIVDCVLIESKSCHVITFNFDFEMPTQVEEFKEMIGLQGIFLYDGNIPTNINDEITKACKMAQKKELGAYTAVKLTFDRIITSIFYNEKSNSIALNMSAKKSNNEESLVLKCHQYIVNNSDKNVEVEELCKEFSVSQSYVYKCFKNVLKMSTKEFITYTKIHMTESILLRTDKSVQDIAVENGYANSYQYSNIFKRVHGISPSAFRKQNKI